MVVKLLIINILTFIRIIGSIVLVAIYNKYGGYVTSIVSLICYATDSIDGILARKWHASTFFGALFDGIADKLFTIVNFIVLYLITPYALIPVIIEVLIIIVQMVKFSRNINVKSNVVGKFKVWILAISVVFTFIASDIGSVSFIPEFIKEYVLNIPDNVLYLVLLLPVIIMEVLTLLSYLLEVGDKKNIELLSTKPKKIESVKLKGKDRLSYMKDVWLNPEFYEEHKDDSNLRDLRKLSKNR